MSPRPWLRTLGRTGLEVSAVAAGGGPLGSMPEAFGYEVAAADAVALVHDVLRSEVRVIDTANGYSDGESERRIGTALAELGGVPPGYLVVTKVDGKDGDYSGARVRASVRESQERLGLEHLPLVHLHDPEFALDQGLDAPGGAVDALVALRDEGVIGHLGLAGGDVAVMHRFLDLDVFEVLLTHNRWSLVDRSAGDLIDRAHRAGLGVVNAAYLGGGILADPDGPPRYGYRPASEETMSAVRAMAALAAEFEVPLATVALQFSLRDPRIDVSVVGISKPSRLTGLAGQVAAELPGEFWERLEELVPPARNWLDAPGD